MHTFGRLQCIGYNKTSLLHLQTEFRSNQTNDNQQRSHGSLFLSTSIIKQLKGITIHQLLLSLFSGNEPVIGTNKP